MSDEPTRPGGEMVVYQTEDGRNRILVKLEDETVWLTQAMMAELYETSVPNVNIHIRNVLDERELAPEATIKEYLIVRQEGSRQVERPVKHYNLDMILAVGYRVRSPHGVMFLDQTEFRAQRRQDIRMRDWELFLDKFLRDTDLSVLDDAGSVSHGQALAWAHRQYDAFAGQRRVEAEARAEARYLEDLRESARTVESLRRTAPARPPKPENKPTTEKRKRGGRK